MCSRAVCNIIIDAHWERIGLLEYHTHTFTQKIHVHISVNIFFVHALSHGKLCDATDHAVITYDGNAVLQRLIPEILDQ